MFDTHLSLSPVCCFPHGTLREEFSVRVKKVLLMQRIRLVEQANRLTSH